MARLHPNEIPLTVLLDIVTDQEARDEETVPTRTLLADIGVAASIEIAHAFALVAEEQIQLGNLDCAASAASAARELLESLRGPR